MKSAVEWFAIELRQCLEKNGKIELTPTLLDKLEEQAKEMEKEQIEKAFEEGIEEMINRINSHTMCKHTDVSAEQYYKETFKSE